MRAGTTIISTLLLIAAAGCDPLSPAPPEAPPSDIVIDTHYHLTSEGPDGRTILSFDRWGQVESGGQLTSVTEISGGPPTHLRICRDDRIPCVYDGEDAVPVALTPSPDAIVRFYQARNLEADAVARGDCVEVEVRATDQALKRYRFCQVRGLVAVEAFPATGHPRRMNLLDNCGIGSSDICEAQVPPVPLALPER